MGCSGTGAPPRIVPGSRNTRGEFGSVGERRVAPEEIAAGGVWPDAAHRRHPAPHGNGGVRKLCAACVRVSSSYGKTMKERLQDVIRSRPLLGDGAMGTQLMLAGLE